MNCPFCAEKIKNEAIVCRHCGRDLPKKSETPLNENDSKIVNSTTSGANSPKRSQLKILAGIGALIVIFGIIFILRSESENIAACKSEVLDYLKQPSTAEWQQITETEELNSDTLISFPDGSVKEDTTAIITGSVKSQNAFGAMISTNFKCSKPVWEDYWEIDTWGDGESAP